jgi:hypothetical protein
MSWVLCITVFLHKVDRIGRVVLILQDVLITSMVDGNLISVFENYSNTADFL